MTQMGTDGTYWFGRWGARLCASAMVFVLCGCMVGPDFKRPEMAVPAAFELPEVDAPARMSEVNSDAADVARWWGTFNDPLLTSLVERAGSANLDVQTATLRVREARLARDIAVSGLLPNVNLGLGA